MTDKRLWFGKVLEGRGRNLIEILSRHLPVWTEKNHEISVRIAGMPADIRTEHLRNTMLGR
jgi:hypothetical protein